MALVTDLDEIRDSVCRLKKIVADGGGLKDRVELVYRRGEERIYQNRGEKFPRSAYQRVQQMVTGFVLLEYVLSGLLNDVDNAIAAVEAAEGT